MAEKKDEKKPVGSIDDFLYELANQHTKDLESSFKAYDGFMKKENENHYLLNIFYPAVDKMYETFSAEVSKLGKDDEKIGKRGKELKLAAIAGMKKFFEKTSPEVLKAVEDIKEEEELHSTLAHFYDEYTGQDVQKGEGMGNLINHLSKSEDATIGDARRVLYETKKDHADKAFGELKQKFISHHFSKYQKHQLGAHVKKELKDSPYKIKSIGQFLKLQHGDYLQLRDSIKTGQFHEKAPPKYFGLSYEAKKEDKPKT